MEKPFVKLALLLALIAGIIFVLGCYSFSVSSTNCGACLFIYNYQSLIAGILALLAAVIALVPVFEQVRLARVQSALMTREVLIKRLDSVGVRRRMVAKIVSSITDDFNATIYPDPEGDAVISAHWAHDAEQEVSFAVAKLERMQKTRSDPKSINSERDNLLLVVKSLGDCLYLIPIPDRAPWEDEDQNISKEQQAVASAQAEKEAKQARKQLPGKITAVKRSGKILDDAYNDLVEALRMKLRNIDDSIVERDA